MNKTIDLKIKSLLSKMTIREKIGQLNQCMPPQNNEELIKIKHMIKHGEIGSIILANSATAGNDKQEDTRVELYNELQRIAIEESPNGIPIIYGRDVIHGHRTVYPVPLAQAASFNPELIEKCYRETAEEATVDSVHWSFTPMLDLSRDPRWGRIIEGPGEDPFVGKEMAKAVIKGLQGESLSNEDSIVACAKHYIGYGASEGGRDYHRTEITDYSLYNYYLPAFQSAVEAGVGTVMSSFNDISGQPITSSRYYLKDILRGHLGFKGFVVSDWGAVSQLKRQGVAKNNSECAELAINAGLDMDMVDNCYIDNLEKLVQEGKVTEKTIDESVYRILYIKFLKGLFENPYCNRKEVDYKSHRVTARKVAQESMILLKNSENILPLKKDVTVALLGPFVRERTALLGSWTLDGKSEETPNLLESMRNALPNGSVLTIADDTGLFDNKYQIIARSDVVILALGESEKVTGEARSLSNISLSAEQIDLIKSVHDCGKKVIGVFFCGRPIAMDGIADLLDGVLYAWHCGSETTTAVCDILFGDVSPSGRTAVTFPRKATHIPLYYNITSSGRHVNCYYGENPQNCYVDSLPTPYYPFGFGLSYGRFEYTDLKCDRQTISINELNAGQKIKVEINVTNCGEYDSKETVQLYIRDTVAQMMRPIRELKAFKKVFISAGEKTKVSFELGAENIGYYLSNGEYIVEPGEIEIYVGKNCIDTLKCVVFVEE